MNSVVGSKWNGVTVSGCCSILTTLASSTSSCTRCLEIFITVIILQYFTTYAGTIYRNNCSAVKQSTKSSCRQIRTIKSVNNKIIIIIIINRQFLTRRNMEPHHPLQGRELSIVENKQLFVRCLKGVWVSFYLPKFIANI